MINDIFSTREIASSIWFAVFIIFCLCSKSIRHSFREVVVRFFKFKELLIGIAILAFYILVAVLFLNKISLWDTTLIKDTILWFLFTGIVLLFNSGKDNVQNKNCWWDILRDNLKILVIWEFIFNFYTFSLCIELILIPSIIFLCVMQVYAEHLAKKQEEYKKTLSFINSFLGIIFIIIFCYVLYKTVTEYDILFSIANLKAILLPILFATITLPYFYFTALFVQYDSVWRQANHLFRNQNNEYRRKLRREILLSSNISMYKLKKVSKHLSRLAYLNDEPDIFIRKVVQKPLHKRIKIGSMAKLCLFNDIEKTRNLLSQNGIGTLSEWECFGNGFQSITSYYNIPSELESPFNISNTLAYYLTGEETYIKRLELVLSINNAKEKDAALFKFQDLIIKTHQILNLGYPSLILNFLEQRKGTKTQKDNYYGELNNRSYDNKIEVWEFVIETKL